MQKNDKILGRCLCLAALLWTIWLLCNKYTYKDTRIKISEFGFLIKHRAYSWAKAVDLIYENQQTIWAVSPLRAFITCRTLNLITTLDNWFKVS